MLTQPLFALTVLREYAARNPEDFRKQIAPQVPPEKRAKFNEDFGMNILPLPEASPAKDSGKQAPSSREVAARRANRRSTVLSGTAGQGDAALRPTLGA
jgi:hypothetical protein